MSTALFAELTIILSVSLVLATLFQRLNQPSILAYILAGCLLGPTAMGWVGELEPLIFISEFGVVFLLFTLGLEFSLEKLISLKRAVFLLGSVQVVVCTSIFFGALYLWGASAGASFVLAGALAFSSTAIVTKLLAEKKDLGRDYAQLGVGILLFQDLAAIVFLIITPTLTGDANTNLLNELAIALGKGLALFFLLIAIGKWILPLAYHEIAKTRSEEIFVLSTLVIVLLASALMHAFHMSMALGSFIIGMMLGGSHFRHQIETDIRPFKDILLGLFFVSVGLHIDLQMLLDYWYRILASAICLLIFKCILISAIAAVLGENRHTALRTGLILAQGGEFGFALITMATMGGTIPKDVSSFMLLVIITSMVASPFLINHAQQLSERIFSKKQPGDTDNLGAGAGLHGMHNHVIIGGYGRTGRTVAALLENNHIPYIVLEHNANAVKAARTAGNHNIIYGNCNRLEMLSAAGIADAALVVLSFKDLHEAVETLRALRAKHPSLHIIVRAHHEEDFEALWAAGANHVIPEMLEASFAIASEALLSLGLDEEMVFEQIRERREAIIHRGKPA